MARPDQKTTQTALRLLPEAYNALIDYAEMRGFTHAGRPSINQSANALIPECAALVLAHKDRVTISREEYRELKEKAAVADRFAKLAAKV